MKAGEKAKRIREAAQAYFEACDATRERVILKNGEVTYHQLPYTIEGLCAKLGVSRAALMAYKERGGGNKAEREAYAWALSRVEQYVMERALLGELNTSVASLLLKSWGYGEEGHEKAVGVKVVLEDPEGLAR